MTPLSELIKQMGIKKIPFVDEHKAAKKRWLKEQAPLFARVCEKASNESSASPTRAPDEIPYRSKCVV